MTNEYMLENRLHIFGLKQTISNYGILKYIKKVILKKLGT